MFNLSEFLSRKHGRKFIRVCKETAGRGQKGKGGNRGGTAREQLRRLIQCGTNRGGREGGLWCLYEEKYRGGLLVSSSLGRGGAEDKADCHNTWMGRTHIAKNRPLLGKHIIKCGGKGKARFITSSKKLSE